MCAVGVWVQAMRAGLVANVYLECMQVKQHKKKYSEHVMTDDMKERLMDYSADREIYSKLARSLAPEIFGFEDVKKAIMLLMVRAPCVVLRGSWWQRAIRSTQRAVVRCDLSPS